MKGENEEKEREFGFLNQFIVTGLIHIPQKASGPERLKEQQRDFILLLFPFQRAYTFRQKKRLQLRVEEVINKSGQIPFVPGGAIDFACLVMVRG